MENPALSTQKDENLRSINPLQAELSHQLIALFIREGLTTGSALSERELAEKLSVSRSPIRAALKLLEHFQVVEPRPGGGMRLAMDSPALMRVEMTLPESPQDQLYVQIGQDRVQGQLEEHVTEADLLRRYDVPKALLTKVLTQLVSEGLLQKAQGKGWLFTRLIGCVESNKDSYELRRIIEPAAIRSPGFQPEPERFQACLAMHKQLVDGLVFETPHHALLNINAGFHQMLADFSGNRYFSEIIRQHNRMRRFTESGAVLYPERMLQSCQEHLDILEQIEARDFEWAATLMERHLGISSKGQLGVPG